MASRIEDYAFISDCHTGALVARNGSLDWLCVPRFDSAACFAALLGEPKHGRWQIAPRDEPRSIARRYREGTVVLETDFETDSGRVRLIDLMAVRDDLPRLVRIVEGISGEVPMRMELIMRFDFGSVVPWARRLEEGGLTATAGPDTLRLRTDLQLVNENFTSVAEFTVKAGERVPLVLTWHPSHLKPPKDLDAEKALQQTERWWRKWSRQFQCESPHADAVLRSLITLKALTYQPTGGIVAAVTTSLPEQLGGVRNWDYRFCWLRDATFTLYSLLMAGFRDEACAWREWLLRSVAGSPDQLQMLYGLHGERRLTELELEWLPGYEGSAPVRIGNAATRQFQLDVYGEVLDAMYQSRITGLDPEAAAWRLECSLLRFVAEHWTDPDEGIWEVRGPRRHFTHSKMMAWVALDRAVKSLEQLGLEGPLDRWRALRDEIHAAVCTRGFDTKRNAFVQYYGAKELDASLLMMPLVGFLPAEDPRIQGTVASIERELLHDGFVMRYSTHEDVDGLPPGEGAFLPCSFWLCDNYALMGRRAEAHALFENLLDLRNDVGLLSEEYEPRSRRFLGNFPQAFSEVSLVNSAANLAHVDGPARMRPDGHSRRGNARSSS